MVTGNPRVVEFMREVAPFAHPEPRHPRRAVHGAAPGIEATVGRGPSHFQQGGMVFCMAASSSHCSFDFRKARKPR